MRAYKKIAIIGILPGGIVAAGYVLAMIGRLAHRWDDGEAVILFMAVWGVLGVVELWQEYVRLSKTAV